MKIFFICVALVVFSIYFFTVNSFVRFTDVFNRMFLKRFIHAFDVSRLFNRFKNPRKGESRMRLSTSVN